MEIGLGAEEPVWFLTSLKMWVKKHPTMTTLIQRCGALTPTDPYKSNKELPIVFTIYVSS